MRKPSARMQDVLTRLRQLVQEMADLPFGDGEAALRLLCELANESERWAEVYQDT